MPHSVRYWNSLVLFWKLHYFQQQMNSVDTGKYKLIRCVAKKHPVFLSMDFTVMFEWYLNFGTYYTLSNVWRTSYCHEWNSRLCWHTCMTAQFAVSSQNDTEVMNASFSSIFRIADVSLNQEQCLFFTESQYFGHLICASHLKLPSYAAVAICKL